METKSNRDAKRLSSIAQLDAPQARGQQHGNERRTEPEPDHRAEVVGAYAVDEGHAALDQVAADVLLNRGTHIAEDSDEPHRRAGDALGADVDSEQAAERRHQAG